MMKKRIAVLTAGTIMAASLLFTGCGGGGSRSEERRVGKECG